MSVATPHFSAAGPLIYKKRTRLYPTLVEDLLFLNRNQFLINKT